MHTAWANVVENYSRRTASVESDKLVACAAIAEQFHRVLRSDYVAGLWRSEALFTDLLWETPREVNGARPTRPAEYRAPSWSWAAIDGVVRRAAHTPYLEDPRLRAIALAEITECRVTLEDEEHPFGRVTGGTLVLRGSLVPCLGGVRESGTTYAESYRFTLPSFEQLRRRQLGLEDLSSDGEDEINSIDPVCQRAAVIVDCQDDDTSGRIWAVPFYWVPGRNGTMNEVIGIGVLELAPPVNGSGPRREKTRFRRIGIFAAAGSADTSRRTGLKHPLWDPLIRAMKGGQWPLVDIEIV